MKQADRFVGIAVKAATAKWIKKEAKKRDMHVYAMVEQLVKTEKEHERDRDRSTPTDTRTTGDLEILQPPPGEENTGATKMRLKPSERLALICRVSQWVYDYTGSFQPVSTDLAYLLWAIAEDDDAPYQFYSDADLVAILKENPNGLYETLEGRFLVLMDSQPEQRKDNTCK
jgi:hypothetical protein